MNNKSNKYRVSIYLGKSNYEKLQTAAYKLDTNVSSLTKVLFETGLQLVDILEAPKGVINNATKSKN